MVPGDIGDAAESCLENRFLVDMLEPFHNLTPIVVNSDSKILFIASGSNADEIDALRLDPI